MHRPGPCRACPSRRNRWLIIAAFSIGGGAIWLMHFTAMLGFEVPESPVRYGPAGTVLSLATAIVTVGVGLLVVGHGKRSLTKTMVAGAITGIGVLAMHYSGMAALHVAGEIHYRPTLVVASGIVAVTAATLALWFTISVQGWGPDHRRRPRSWAWPSAACTISVWPRWRCICTRSGRPASVACGRWSCSFRSR